MNDDLQSTAARIPMKNLSFFGPFFTQMGPKVDFAPGAIRISLCWYQRWKLWWWCQKVVLKSFKGLCGPAKIRWDIYRSVDFTGKMTQPSSVTELQDSSPSRTGKTRQYLKKKQKLKKSLWKWIAIDCARQSRLNMCNFCNHYHAEIFCCLKVDILPVKTPFPKWSFASFSKFW